MDAVPHRFLALDNPAKELEDIAPRRSECVEHKAHTILWIALACFLPNVKHETKSRITVR